MRQIIDILGIDTQAKPWIEWFLSTLGGLIAIYSILVISRTILGANALPIVASMGASAVLLFAVPHGQLSQPWAVFGGHLIAALVGVACSQWLGVSFLSAAVAVGISIGFMHMLHCIHPPGGATALFAVMGGPAVQALGFQYVLTPVMLNSMIILLVAFLFNYPFPHRRYPAKLAPVPETDAPSSQQISHEDMVYALSEMDTFIDVTEQDLIRIYDIATRRKENPETIHSTDIQPGLYYSNGKEGRSWQVRQVVEIQETTNDDCCVVIFRVVAGTNKNLPGKASLHEFTRWSRFQVVMKEGRWLRKNALSS